MENLLPAIKIKILATGLIVGIFTVYDSRAKSYADNLQHVS